MPATFWILLLWGSWALIAYAYALFPLLLAAIARTRAADKPAEPLAEEELPQVALVVAAYNEEPWMQAKLQNTWQLDYPADRLTLHVGSDGSSDGTARILLSEKNPRLRAYVYSQRRGKVSVLNDLVRNADAEILVMSDANTRIAPDAVRRLVAPFRDPRVQCVSGELSLEQDGGASGEGLYWKYEGWIKRNESRLGFLMGCNGGIFAIRRSAYETLPASTIVEDLVTCIRIVERGGRVLFDPAARATEPACPSSRAEMVRKIRIGAGGFQALGLARGLLHPRHGLRAFAFWGHKVLRWLVPVFLLAALAANVALLGQMPYRILFTAQLAGAAVAVLAYHLRPGASLPTILRPISYFYLMNYALLCGLLRFAFGTQKVTWERVTAESAAG